jgi:hypothetical protein
MHDELPDIVSLRPGPPACYGTGQTADRSPQIRPVPLLSKLALEE